MNKARLVAVAALALPMASLAAHAEDAAPAKWSDTIKLGVQLEAGITGNPAGPRDNLNYGHSFTDRANEPLLNQGLLSLGRPLDPKATDYDVGFKVQGMFGTDARFTHFAHFLDKVTKSRYQLDLVEASVSVHTPWLTEGGIDFQGGLFPTPLGFETIDASTNPFYSHSYIFNFGLPFKHSGVLAITHATPIIDVYTGVTAGNQTIVGADNNGSAAFLGGVKLTLLDGNFSVLALTHIGPENASKAIKPFNSAKYNRAFNDVIVTYKPTEALTLTSEFNYVREDLGSVQPRRIANAEAFGFAQYAAYTLTDTVTLNARAEVYSDTRGYFVAAFPQAQGPVNALQGSPYTAVGYGGHNLYGAITLGATYKPTLPGFADGVTMLIRPEIRVDDVMSGPARYNAGKDRAQVTLAADIVLTY
eukprot:gene5312-5365_t